jgi:hypothetical protein
MPEPAHPPWKNVERVMALDKQEGNVAFEMGDLILEDIPWGEDGAHNGAEEAMRRYADLSGVGYETIRDRRKTSARVPPGARAPGVPWTTYREVAKQANGAVQHLLDHMGEFAPATKSGRWTQDAIQEVIAELRRPQEQPPAAPPPPTPTPPVRPALQASPQPRSRELLLPLLHREPVDAQERELRGEHAFRKLIEAIASVGGDHLSLFTMLTDSSAGSDPQTRELYWQWIEQAERSIDLMKRFLRGGRRAIDSAAPAIRITAGQPEQPENVVAFRAKKRV